MTDQTPKAPGMDERERVQTLLEAFSKTTSAVLTRRHAAEVVEELRLAGFSIEPLSPPVGGEREGIARIVRMALDKHGLVDPAWVGCKPVVDDITSFLLASLPQGCPDGSETGWLIEHRDKPVWWTGWPGGFKDEELWTADSLKAIRFVRREDAETLALYNFDGECRITEHSWPMLSASPHPSTDGKEG